MISYSYANGMHTVIILSPKNETRYYVIYLSTMSPYPSPYLPHPQMHQCHIG